MTIAERSALTVAETYALDRYEATIRAGLDTFVEVGRALEQVRDLRLYRAGFSSFEDYCREKWGLTFRHVNRLIGAAKVADNLGPMGPKPANERQARPLVALPAPEQREVWQEAVEEAGGELPTAATVKAIGERRRAALTPAESEEKERARAGQALAHENPPEWAMNNPFARFAFGNWSQTCDVHDRIEALRRFDVAQLREVLALADLQKTVRGAAEARLRALERETGVWDRAAPAQDRAAPAPAHLVKDRWENVQRGYQRKIEEQRREIERLRGEMAGLHAHIGILEARLRALEPAPAPLVASGMRLRSKRNGLLEYLVTGQAGDDWWTLQPDWEGEPFVATAEEIALGFDVVGQGEAPARSDALEAPLHA